MDLPVQLVVAALFSVAAGWVFFTLFANERQHRLNALHLRHRLLLDRQIAALRKHGRR